MSNPHPLAFKVGSALPQCPNFADVRSKETCGVIAKMIKPALAYDGTVYEQNGSDYPSGCSYDDANKKVIWNSSSHGSNPDRKYNPLCCNHTKGPCVIQQCAVSDWSPCNNGTQTRTVTTKVQNAPPCPSLSRPCGAGYCSMHYDMPQSAPVGSPADEITDLYMCPSSKKWCSGYKPGVQFGTCSSTPQSALDVPLCGGAKRPCNDSSGRPLCQDGWPGDLNHQTKDRCQIAKLKEWDLAGCADGKEVAFVPSFPEGITSCADGAQFCDANNQYYGSIVRQYCPATCGLCKDEQSLAPSNNLMVDRDTSLPWCPTQTYCRKSAVCQPGEDCVVGKIAYRGLPWT